MTNWGKFETVDAKALNDEAKNLGDGDYPEIPNGKYEVHLDSMILKPTKKDGAPMVAAKFTILEGDFKNQKIFVNMVVIKGDENDKYRLSAANRFLKSLGTDVEISFEGVSAYEALIERVFNETESLGLEYVLEIEDAKTQGFKKYTIREVFEN